MSWRGQRVTSRERGTARLVTGRTSGTLFLDRLRRRSRGSLARSERGDGRRTGDRFFRGHRRRSFRCADAAHAFG
jgi:hypothetical protein